MTIEHRTPPQAPAEAADDTRFFADHYMPVMRLCMRHLRDESDAEDAAQEVFRRAVQRRAELRGDPLPWLITVAKNVCRDELRRRRNGWTALERSAAMAPAEEASTAVIEDNPERLVVGHLFVRDLLGRLTPAERRVVAARVYEGASGVDAAQLLGVSSSTTRVLLSRARQKLRAYLEDGQAALAGIPFLGLRALHSLRRALLQRPLAGEAGAALFLPAALMFTMMMGPGATAPAVAAAPPPLLHSQPVVLSDARVASTSSPVITALDHRAITAPNHANGGTGGPVEPKPLLPTLLPGYDRAQPYDVEPSPDYPSDHTVLMLGGNGACVQPACSELFESTDGGVTWTNMHSTGLSGQSLILPPASFAQGTFYAWGGAGLQMTTDGGRTFVQTSAPLGGYAVAAPGWSGLGVLLGNEALWQLTNGLTLKSISPFAANQEAVGAPLTLGDGHGGIVILQPVSPIASLNKSTVVLRCATVCSSSVALPFYSTNTALVASPNVASDHTIYAVGYGAGLAVSHDDGRSFGPPLALNSSQLLSVPNGNARRLVATVVLGTNQTATEFSDDDGATWHRATVDPKLNLENVFWISSLAPGRLLASMLRTDEAGYYGFACSTDGSAWTACSADTTR